MEAKAKLRVEKGGPGSGHHGHRGRPGKVGGSLPDEFAGMKVNVHIDHGPSGWTPGPGTITRVDKNALVYIDDVTDPDRVDLVREGLTSLARTPGHIENLADNMREEGYHIDKPITVAIEQNGEITIIDGTHRIAAAKHAGYSVIPAEVRYFGLSDVEYKLDYANEEKKSMTTARIVTKGGPGSGHHGHRGRPGKVGGSLPSRTVTRGDVVRLFEDSNLSEYAKEMYVDTFARHLRGIPREHIEGLERISFDLPSDLEYENVTSGFQGWRVEGIDGLVAGMYDEDTRTIHIHPVWTESEGTFIHELGHHVVAEADLVEGEFGPVVFELHRRLKFGDAGMPDLTAMGDLYGIRRYSISSSTEFLADTYLCWAKGSDEQWERLNYLIKRKTNWDLDKLFGKRPSE